MLAVCAVLSIAAAVAIPSAQPVEDDRANAAAGEVVLALRFARDEAIRTQGWRMFYCEPNLNQVRIASLVKIGTDLVVTKAAVSQPGSGAPYAVRLDAATTGAAMSLTDCGFTFAKGAATTMLAFGPDGYPVRGTGKDAEQKEALQAGQIVLGTGHVVRTVTVETTGRVTTTF